ncbi:helix-turn-helix domain-containing protein [Rhodopseudomonas sp.]|uniref:helix-turn-helix domain-containing protein n=1 Tax=Rhodopseudomonas sp. TaxID=1078 RepID=UPI0039E4651B
MKDDVRKRLGRQLAMERKARSLRLHDMARLTGRQAARISEIETGKANSTIDTIADAGEALDLSLVFVPNDRLAQVLQLVGEMAAPAVPIGDPPSVFEQVFVDDSPEDDDAEETVPHVRFR